MRTVQRVWFEDARAMGQVGDGAAHLIVTSPPYPMIGMWDEAFAACDPLIGEALAQGQGWEAFSRMHAVLDGVWRECWRALAPGGFMCVNVGNATRTVRGEFCFYPNNARVLDALVRLGMTPLPEILWRKKANAPNKFMGSGTLPAGAYVTNEHEYILIFRKGPRRIFGREERERRAAAACFWEERNAWFSDLWSDIEGVRQQLGAARARSAAFPLEIPYRLICMYSLYGDTVLDPFAGSGTTLLAAATAGRDGIGYERDPGLAGCVEGAMERLPALADAVLRQRLSRHRAFVQALPPDKAPRYATADHLPVVTRQERDLRLHRPAAVRRDGAHAWGVAYAPLLDGEPGVVSWAVAEPEGSSIRLSV